MITAYEIRFFQVGNASKGGDAILIRFLDEFQKPTVIIVDGGYSETDFLSSCIAIFPVDEPQISSI